MGRLKLEKKEDLSKCLEGIVEDERSMYYSADWTKAVDRGGLLHVADKNYTVFAEIELMI